MDGRRQHRLLSPLLCTLGAYACSGGPEGSGSATGESLGSELRGPGFVIDGAAAGDAMVAIPVADINGDGLEDLLVNVERPLHPVAFLVFGKEDEAPVDLAAVEAGESVAGVEIDWGLVTEDENSLLNREVVGVGDINGDGLGDLGAALLDRSGGWARADVIFGAPELASPLDLQAAAAGMDGFSVDTRLDSALDGARRIHGVGDINGDGFADLSLLQIGGFSDHLALLFGGERPEATNLADIDAGLGGVFLGHPYSSRVLGPADVDGDGFADLVYAEYGGPFQTASFVSVRFGEAGFNVDSPARRVLVKDELYDTSRLLAAATGDMDGDGLSDLIIAAAVDPAELRAFVVFGAGLDGELDLKEELGDHGYVISLGTIADGLWDPPPLPALEAVRDQNGDGRSELLVRTTNGTYLLYGKADLEAQILTEDGVLFDTPPLVGGDEVGDVTGIGSIRGGEPTDRVYSEPAASPAGREGAGRAYVLFGAN